jgi:hypothetical protein
MLRRTVRFTIATICIQACVTTLADTISFTNPFPPGTVVNQGATSDTIRSSGYLFTYTRDKLFTGGLGGPPIGRTVRVPWPLGIEAQAVTAGPTPAKAKITIQRVDASAFEFTAFSAKLLANTAGAGGTFEVVPFLNGEEQLANPVAFDATGVAGNVFSYDRTPNPRGTTIPLVGYDKYSIDLYVDFALVALTFAGAPVNPALGDYNEDGIVNAADYSVWRNHVGESIALPNEDPATTPGEVTREDYSFWKSHYGQMAGGAATPTAIPEPQPIELHLIAALAGFERRYNGRPINATTNQHKFAA